MRRSNQFHLPLILALGLCLTSLALPAAAQNEPTLRAGDSGSYSSLAQSSSSSQPALREPLAQNPPAHKVKLKRDQWTAYRLARDPWLYKTAAADPSLIEVICEHPGPAKLLAKNRHLGDVADTDHYLCRRLTQWRGATWALIKNREADRVVMLDPQGIYLAIQRDPKIGRVLSKHLFFNQMVDENPDLGKFLSLHM